MVDTKQCPQCSESVKAEAVICKHCRFDFRPPPPPTRTKGDAYVRIIATMILLAGVVVAFAVFAGQRL